jgi:predicted HTH transcriptional regulator
MNLKETIKQPEGRRLEFKVKIPVVSDLAKTIVAFANDAGGILYIGVKDDPREIVGLPEDDLMQIEEKLSNFIYDHCYPVIVPEISIVNIDEKYLIKVQIYRGNNLPYFLKSKGKKEGTYIRVGSSNRQATEEIIADLERQKRNTTFDAELLFDKPFQEIDIKGFTQFLRIKPERN